MNHATHSLGFLTAFFQSYFQNLKQMALSPLVREATPSPQNQPAKSNSMNSSVFLHPVSTHVPPLLQPPPASHNPILSSEQQTAPGPPCL